MILQPPVGYGGYGVRLYVKACELLPGDVIKRAYSVNGMALDNLVVDKIVITERSAIVISGDLSFRRREKWTIY